MIQQTCQMQHQTFINSYKDSWKKVRRRYQWHLVEVSPWTVERDSLQTQIRGSCRSCTHFWYKCI